MDSDSGDEVQSQATEKGKKKKAVKCKLPTNDGDGHAKRVCAPNWHKDEENCLIEKFMDNHEILQAELKGAGSKGGQVMAQKKDQIWQKITDAINR